MLAAAGRRRNRHAPGDRHPLRRYLAQGLGAAPLRERLLPARADGEPDQAAQSAVGVGSHVVSQRDRQSGDVLTFAKPKPRQRFEKIEQTTVGCRLRSAAMIGAAQARNFPLGRILLQLFKAHLRRLIRQRVSSVGRILPSYAQRCT
jgi:hypothetical protein